MPTFDRALPPLLAEINALPYDYADGEGIDFEPYDQFQSAEENAGWIRAWTGNQTLDGAEYRVFGQDGTGGLAAIWLAREGAPLLEQPIVFFGSEGELGVIAASFADYLWLLAGGHGPLEAVEYPGSKRAPSPQFAAFAEKHAPGKKRPAKEIVATAKAEFPSFEDDIRATCR